MADLFSPVDEGVKCFIALKSKSKTPLSTDWPNKGKRFNDAYKAGSNVGIILGEASGLLDVDLDCTQAVALADVILQSSSSGVTCFYCGGFFVVFYQAMT